MSRDKLFNNDNPFDSKNSNWNFGSHNELPGFVFASEGSPNNPNFFQRETALFNKNKLEPKSELEKLRLQVREMHHVITQMQQIIDDLRFKLAKSECRKIQKFVEEGDVPTG